MVNQFNLINLRKLTTLIVIVIILSALIVFFLRKTSSEVVLDVIDLNKADLKTRLLVTSLQGIANRDSPRLYVIWWNLISEYLLKQRFLQSI